MASLPKTHVSFTNELVLFACLFAFWHVVGTRNRGHLQRSPEELLKGMWSASALGEFRTITRGKRVGGESRQGVRWRLEGW